MRAEPLDQLEARGLERVPARGVQLGRARAFDEPEKRAGDRADRLVLFEQQLRELALAALVQPRKELLLLEVEMARDLVFERGSELREQRAPDRIVGSGRLGAQARERLLETAEQAEHGDVLLIQLATDLALQFHHDDSLSGCVFRTQIAHAHRLALRTRHFAGFFRHYGRRDADQRLDVIADLLLDLASGLFIQRTSGFDLYGQFVQATAPLDHELVVRRDVRQADQHSLDLRGIDVHAADDQHVVVTPGDALQAQVRPAAGAALRGGAGDVARAIAEHRQCLLGERRDDELARLALGDRPPAAGVDDLEEKMVLPAVQPVLRLALDGYARPHDLGQAINVDRLQAKPDLDLAPHGLAPWLGAEQPDLELALLEVGAGALGDLGDVERIRGRCAQHARAARAEAPGAEMRAEPAGEQAVSIGVVDHIARSRPGAGHRARHQARPGVEILLRVADHGRLAGGAGGGVQARKLVARARAQPG